MSLILNVCVHITSIMCSSRGKSLSPSQKSVVSVIPVCDLEIRMIHYANCSPCLTLRLVWNFKQKEHRRCPPLTAGLSCVFLLAVLSDDQAVPLTRPWEIPPEWTNLLSQPHADGEWIAFALNNSPPHMNKISYSIEPSFSQYIYYKNIKHKILSQTFL